MAKYKDTSTAETIEAVQFFGNFEEIEMFVGGDAEFRDGKLLVATTQGPLWANNMDYIVRNHNGEFSACRPGLFEKNHVPIRQVKAKSAEAIDDSDTMRGLCIRQGYVPPGCKLPGQMIYALTSSQGDACKGCNGNRSVCKGRPRE